MNRKLMYNHIFEYYCLKLWFVPNLYHYSYGDIPFVTKIWDSVKV